MGVIAVFTLQETPAKTKGWLTEEDKRFLELRTKFMYGGGAMKAKNEFRWPDVIQALKVSYPSIEIWCWVPHWLNESVRSHLDHLAHRYLQYHGVVRVLTLTSDDREKHGLYRSRCSRSFSSPVHLRQLLRCGKWILQRQISPAGVYCSYTLAVRLRVSSANH